MPIKDCNRKAIANYAKKVKRIYIKFYPTEKDLLQWIEDKKPTATYIKNLIRADKANAEQEQAEKNTALIDVE